MTHHHLTHHEKRRNNSALTGETRQCTEPGSLDLSVANDSQSYIISYFFDVVPQ